MSAIAHRFITIVFAVCAIASIVFKMHYESQNLHGGMITDKIWVASHRGYISHFGYLNHQFDLRLVETQVEAEVRQDGDLTMAIEFTLFDQNGLLGSFAVQFEAQLVGHSNRFAFNVNRSSAAILHCDGKLNMTLIEPMVVDLLHNMFSSPRDIILAKPNEVIVEVPYLGILRATTTDYLRLIKR